MPATSDRSGTGRLRRTLGVSDAVIIGLGSMVGAGVYSAWSAAARPAGSLLLVGLAVAAIVASLNAFASARLAVLHPESGGSYVYGRERLGHVWGFVAGWGFVVGKTASCAAMASTLGVYVLPDHSRMVAVAAIVAITAVNIGGIHRTVAVTRMLLAVAGVVLSVVFVSGWSWSGFEASAAWPWNASTESASVARSAYDTLQSAGLLFFAFAGYARIATLGEEVKDPRRTIPLAMAVSLSCVLVLYALLGFTLLGSIGPAVLGETVDPLRFVVEQGRFSDIAPLVRAGAALAALGALLNLLPAVSRTVLAMARNSDLPRYFATIDPARTLPVRAEVTISVIAIAIVTFFDLRSSIALSGVGVLTYYAITNASALTLSGRAGRISSSIGLIGCLSLALCLPPHLVLTGSAVLFTGLVVRVIRSRFF